MRAISLIFILSSFVSFGQEAIKDHKVNDSIGFFLKRAKDTLRKSYLRKAYYLSKDSRNDSLLKLTSFEYGLNSYFERDTAALKEVNESLELLFIKNKDSFCLAKKYHFKALFFRIQNKLDSSFFYYHRSKNISTLKKDSLSAGRRLLSMARMQEKAGDYLGSEITTIEGLRFLEPQKSYRFTANLYNNLGIVMMETSRYEMAREYFQKATELYKKIPNKFSRERELLTVLNNIGLTYIRENSFDKAMSYYEKGMLTDSLSIKYPFQYQLIYGNLSFVKWNLGDLKNSLEGYKDVMRSKVETKNLYGQGISHLAFSEYYINTKDFVKAKYHANRCIEIAKQTNDNQRIIIALRFLSDITKGEESRNYLIRHIRLKDSINNQQRTLKNQFARVRYETEKTEKENANLKLVSAKNLADKERAEQRQIIGWLVAIALFLTLGLSVTSYRNRRKKLLYKSQLEKANAREQERQQIAKSLHDEVAGDLRVLHQKLVGNQQQEEAAGLEKIKDNVRNLSHQLSSVSFEDVSFKDQMINLATDYFSKDFKVFVKGLEDDAWSEVNETIKRTLYLSVRESVQNAIRHAQASRFDILFTMRKKEVSVSAKDNGKGFDAEKAVKGIGLKNMEERVQELRGTLTVKSSEKGTEIQIMIPRNGR